MTEEDSNPQTIDTGLACFAVMANFFEKPISIDQIKHKYDRQNSPFEEYELLQLAKEFSFKARFVETNGSGWIKPLCRQSLRVKTVLILFSVG